MIYFCCDQRRRKDLQARNRQVAAALRLNGIDCLEVLDHEAPPVIQRQQTLLAIRDGVVLYSQAGALPEQALTNLVQAIRDVDMVEVHASIAAGAAESADPSA